MGPRRVKARAAASGGTKGGGGVANFRPRLYNITPPLKKVDKVDTFRDF